MLDYIKHLRDTYWVDTSAHYVSVQFDVGILELIKAVWVRYTITLHVHGLICIAATGDLYQS